MFLNRCCRRLCSTNLNTIDTIPEVTSFSKWKYKLDSQVENDLQNEKIKPRQHPGIVKVNVINVPNSFLKATKIILEDNNDYPKKDLFEKSKKLVNYLKCKKPPMEDGQLRDQISVIRDKVTTNLERKNSKHLNNLDVIKSQMNNLLKKTVYNWFPVKYTTFNCLCYLLGRSAAEYAVLIKILSEIKSRNPKWKPKTLFDFGSGIGTVTWAANTIWPKSFTEYFNVDSSADMNDLAELLLKGGRGEKKNPLRGVFYRQFFPSKPVPYDLVISAYTMMELPCLQSRIEAVKNLWNKTTDYLIIVEQGTYEGFKIINEIRDFVLSLGNSHVFSPCPQDSICPKFASNDGKPCNFGVRFYGMPFLDAHKSIQVEHFSYIVLKKGPREGKETQWPRLINPTLVRHKHVICNLCTSEGEIEQSVFTASKYGKMAYRCAKASDWGDRLPMNIKDHNDCVVMEKSNDKNNNE